MDTLPALDWARPWMAPYAALGRRVADAWRAGATLADALNAAAREARVAGAPRFVPAPPRRRRQACEAYEAAVARTREVPVRERWHDLFNGVVWLRRPALKWALNHGHAEELRRLGAGAVRGPRRDALTLLDENGALLAVPPPLADALRARDWHALFVAHRARWAEARVEIVGHGLLEQLARAPRKALAAHAWLVPADAFDAPPLPAVVTPASWLALPVLGVPGWCADNADAAFYADASVFRASSGTSRARPHLSALSTPKGLHVTCENEP